jgi:uncharacterized membrane protein YjgN (DUF898 family)
MHDAGSDFTSAAPVSPAAYEPAFAEPRDAAPRPLSFSFTGTGSEYFRIWIVNVLLSIATLGIYSAWAKVRTLQYFYRNTRLDGASFDYHGKPSAILKGRIIVIALAIVYQLASYRFPVLSLLLVVAVMAVFPLLLVRSLRFRMYNSSYRGLRFGFVGSDAEAYKVFVLWPLAAMLTLGVLSPLAHQRFKRYQHNNARFGTARFAFTAGPRDFYRVYLRAFAMVAIVLVPVVALLVATVAANPSGGVDTALSVGLAIAVFYLAILAVRPYLMARLQNVVWSHTTLAPHAFRSEVEVGRMIFISATNLLAIVMTLGLYLPFAQVRSARYQLERVTLLAAGPLDSFVGGETQQVGALGDAAVDWADIDIAL